MIELVSDVVGYIVVYTFLLGGVAVLMSVVVENTTGRPAVRDSKRQVCPTTGDVYTYHSQRNYCAECGEEVDEVGVESLVSVFLARSSGERLPIRFPRRLEGDSR